MFCVGKAWHNVGVRVENAVTSREAIELARLDYQVKLTDIYVKTEQGEIIVDGKKATIRTANYQVLGVVGNRYNIVQNIEAFEFFDSVVKTGEAIYHSAGALGNGERIWILAKLPNDIIVFDRDIVNKYLLLTNSHDGASALKMYFTPIRVVCQNTLNASLTHAKDGISIRHTASVKSKIEEARRILGLALNFYEKFESNVKLLATRNMTSQEIDEYFDRVLGIKENQEVSTRTENVKKELKYLQKFGKGNNVEGIKNTAWTVYNAVTEYVDYYRTVKGGLKNRINSIVLGSGARLKEKALEEALILVK